MANFLYVQGVDPLPLHESESFNKVRKYIVEAQKKKLAFEADTSLEYLAPGDLSFKVEIPDQDEPGRFSVSVDKVIGVMSTQPKDGTGE
jgi:hypothetical protein